MFSYEFYLDGSIKVSVRASGYIQSAYYAKNGDYGYQIHDALSGSMHDHVLNYKADFDILGEANTMQLTSFVPTTENYVWHDRPRKTMKVERSFIENEDDGKLYYGANGATQFRVVNTDVPNKYGEYRGYRILPAEGTCHLTVEVRYIGPLCLYRAVLMISTALQQSR
jgi:primary-amine oxidase